MVHPAVYAAIVVGGVVIVGLKLYEEYLENKSYEQFQRNRTRYEREYNRFHRTTNDFDFDDDRDYGGEEEDKDNDPYTIRKRRRYSNSDGNSAASSVHELKKSINEDPDQYELSELENSIAERKRRLMAEQAFLDQEEENLRNRKNALMRIYETDDVTSSSTNALDHTKFNSSSMESSEMEEEDQHTLQSHMARFDPFADQFQDNEEEEEHHGGGSSNSESTEIMYVEAEQNLSSSEQNLNATTTDNMGNSTELRYPTPRTTTAPTSISEASAVSSPRIISVSSTHGSESEESWDAVSEAEWNQTSADESDDNQQQHTTRRRRSTTSFSEDDDVVRF